MALLVEPATQKHDAEVVALFTDAQIALDEAYWARAFTPDAPPPGPSQPWIVRTEDNELLGFVAARPVELFVETDYVRAQVLHDLVLREGHLEEEAGAILVKEVIRHADVTVVAGAGIEATALLERTHFHRVGMFLRALLHPGMLPRERRVGTILPLQLESTAETLTGLDAVNEYLAAERRIFVRRSNESFAWQFRGAASHYEVLVGEIESGAPAVVVLRHVAGRFGEELQVVQIYCPNVSMQRLAMGLADVVRERQQPLIVSHFAPPWGPMLEEAGFALHRPRWPLHWILRDPRQRAMGTMLIRPDAWNFGAADGEIDHW